MNWLDEFWGDLLSEEPLRITAAWLTLDEESRRVVYDHLQHMVTDDGWQDVQRESARAALAVIDAPENDPR